MFRALIPPIFRNSRLCVTACGIMHPRCWRLVAWERRNYRPATSSVHYTTSCNTESSAPEDGRDQPPKHVELIGIINKPLLWHLVDVYVIYNTLCIISFPTVLFSRLLNLGPSDFFLISNNNYLRI